MRETEKERVYSVERLCMLASTDNIEKEFDALLSFFAVPEANKEQRKLSCKVVSVLREDTVQEGLADKVVLSNAPLSDREYIVVPGAMEGK